MGRVVPVAGSSRVWPGLSRVGRVILCEWCMQSRYFAFVILVIKFCEVVWKRALTHRRAFFISHRSGSRDPLSHWCWMQKAPPLETPAPCPICGQNVNVLNRTARGGYLSHVCTGNTLKATGVAGRSMMAGGHADASGAPRSAPQAVTARARLPLPKPPPAEQRAMASTTTTDASPEEAQEASAFPSHLGYTWEVAKCYGAQHQL